MDIGNGVQTLHPKYSRRLKEWTRMRDCMEGENAIKLKAETYLPRPAGMSGDYAAAYDDYIERAHFPLICSYALSGILGIMITKLPEFKVPKRLEYILSQATKDGRNLQQLFLDTIVEIFITGRVPLLVDTTNNNEFRFVQYKAEELPNWKTTQSQVRSFNSMTLAVLKQEETNSDEFSHSADTLYKVLRIVNGEYTIQTYDNENKLREEETVVPTYMGNTMDEIPLIIAGSINNSSDIQPIPLISVANCSVQIYRKEADLANSEFLSCNPTLVIAGAQSEKDIPNVVGSSVMIVLPNEAARVFYTETDTAALQHVKTHINDLYEEAIRHGVSILDNRKGVEAAEALRIRQATQSASAYSVFLSALTAIVKGLKIMCKWSGLNPDQVDVDSPTSLTFGIPDSAVLKELVTGFAESGVVPMDIVYKYMLQSGLIDQTISYEDYIELVKKSKALKDALGITVKQEGSTSDPSKKSSSSGSKTESETEDELTK